MEAVPKPLAAADLRLGSSPNGLRHEPRVLTGPLVLLVVLAGCQQPMKTPSAALAAGDFTSARLQLFEQMTSDRTNRRYLLDRMRVGVLTLADGFPRSARTIFGDVYEILRTQGINDDKTVASVVLNEDLKIWKGEPFEQALTLLYYALTQGELGSWDNVRSAANNSLFHLRDFGTDRDGERLDTFQIARRSLIYERAIDQGESPEQAMRKANYLDHGYVARKSNFTLGYLMAGIANQQLDRHEEAADHFNRAIELDPELERLTEELARNRYNTVLIISFGLGPSKQGYGPDRALARYAPRFQSDAARLRVGGDVQPARSYPQVLDVNDMAGDHMWNNLEDVRIAKSALGSVLVTGGAIATQYGAYGSRREAVYGGLGTLAMGLFLKAGAHVDLRYCDVFPQRFYLVPLELDDPAAKIDLKVEGMPGSALVLTALDRPRGDQARLRYVRLPSLSRTDLIQPAPWATTGNVLYSNPQTGAIPGPQLPFLLGGRCVRPPTELVLDEYQRSGHLRTLTLAELDQLYQFEGVVFAIEDQNGYAGRHLLEGGRSLVAPLPGTTGFVRLFGQRHRPYEPRAKQVATITQRQKQRMEPTIAGR